MGFQFPTYHMPPTTYDYRLWSARLSPFLNAPCAMEGKKGTGVVFGHCSL